MKHLPNLLTFVRLFLTLAMFASWWPSAPASAARPYPNAAGVWLVRFSLAAFIVAGVTDFLDGWLARRWKVTSLAGAILDPIADKVLVCGAIVGLLAVGMPYWFAALGGLILFREFAISALREVLAPRGIKLPVTFLAKTKTTVQLLALAGLMILAFWPVWGIDWPVAQLQKAWLWAEMLFFLATLVTSGPASNTPAPPQER